MRLTDAIDEEPDDNFTGNLSIESKAGRANIFAGFNGDISSRNDRFAERTEWNSGWFQA